MLPAEVEVDWEAELAVVVGTEIRGATATRPANAIGGYTVANDISVRDWQRRTLQWFQGKAWDATTPIGPVVVTARRDRSGRPASTWSAGSTAWSDSAATPAPSSSTAPACWPTSPTFTVLRPGDVVLTGTPGGVGMGMTPPIFLADGDVVETEIPGIGTLTNTVRLTA